MALRTQTTSCVSEDQARDLSWQDPSAPAELAVFACDFGLLEPRLALPLLSSCPVASARRQRHLCCSAGDVLDRHRLREAMMLARRSGRPPGGNAVAASGGDAMEED